MAKEISYPVVGDARRQTKAQATEFLREMKQEGWDGRLAFIPAENRYVVYISEVKEGKRVPKEKIPGSIAKMIERQEQEIPAQRIQRIRKEFLVRKPKRIARGAGRTTRDILTAPHKIITEPVIDRRLTPAMEQARKRRSFDVVRGMKKSIPRAPSGARTVFGAGSEEPPAISQTGPARIASGGYGTEMPLIAGTGMGVPRDVAFQAGANKSMRFQVPKVGKMKVGHEAIREEED